MMLASRYLSTAIVIVSFVLLFHTSAMAESEAIAAGSFGSVFEVSTGSSFDFKKLQRVHSSTVYATATRGGLLLTGDMKGRMAAWDMESGSGTILSDTHRGAVRAISFSPDGSLFATASKDRKVFIWKTADREKIRALEGHGSYVYDASFSPDGTRLASAGSDNQLILWDTSTWKQVVKTTAHYNAIYAARFSPDGKYVATCSADKFIKLWNAADLSQSWEIIAHDNGVYGLAFSPDGSLLVSVGGDKTIRVWEASSGTELRSISHPNSVAMNSIAFHPDGVHVYIGDESGELIKVDVVTGGIVESGKAAASIKSITLVN